MADTKRHMKGKKIVVGITGGIAAYKTAELVRRFVKAEAAVQVAMTKNATRFVTPLTFEALSGNRVISDMWAEETMSMDHIAWGQDTDLVIIAPATANFIAKMVHGIADDFLSTMVLAATAKILVCPSMNTQMYLKASTQENLSRLKERGVNVMDPGEGQLACRAEGPGRLPEPEEILEQAAVLVSQQDLEGLKVMVTAGPTIEPIDPIRHITNRSSGKMGYALARAARRRGASVVLISGPTNVVPPHGVAFHGVQTAEDMRRAVFENRPGCHIIVKAAAVMDFRPRDVARQKIKKRGEAFSLNLIQAPDILGELGSTKGKGDRCLLIGFAAETEDLVANAKKKIVAKNLDMIVANDVSREDAGFQVDTNLVKLIYGDGHVEDLPLMTKEEVADLILDRAKTLREGHIEG